MKSDLWAIFGFIMIIIIVLSAGFVIINEFNLVAGSPGPYLNSDTLLNAYRVILGAVVGLIVAIVNLVAASKK